MVESSRKEAQKRYESGNIHKLMNDQIHKIDGDMLDYALETGNNLRRGLSKQLHSKVYCTSTRRALAACLRFPLYDASRRNNFKYVLRPENIRFYIDRLMKELASEYEEFGMELQGNVCPAGQKRDCLQLPPLAEIFEGVRQQLVDQWALPLRREQIRTHYKKIDTYKGFAPTFEQLGDEIMKKVCEVCIDKNTAYAEALKRKPEMNEL